MLVSIITPTYNSVNYIEATIKSIINQTYTEWELLITDDNSFDGTWELIQQYSLIDSRIKVFKLEKNSGPAIARNNSLSNSSGRFVAFCDSDDLWYPSKLEKQLEFMLSNNFAFTFTAYQLISHKGILNKQIINVPKQIDYKSYLKNTIIGCLTVIIDKEKVGEFKMPAIRSSHDMALWLLIMKRGYKAYGLNEVLAYYRIVPNSNTSKKWRAARDVWNVYRKIERINFIKSFYYFIFYVINAILKRI